MVGQLSNNTVAQNGDVVIPTWLVAGSVGLFLGIIFGPVLLASSREGAQKLARLAEAKLKEK